MPPHENKKKILVVDDEEDIRRFLSKLFQENGYNVECAGDGEEAMHAAVSARPDLITLDMSMPYKSGVRFYREIKTHPELDHVPIIIVTGVTGFGGSANDTEQFLKSRGSIPPPEGFVAKPIEQEEILRKVASLL